jgi:hypothetical protein
VTTYDDAGSYSNVNSTAHLDEPILLVRKSTSNPDTMYLHKAMKAHNAPEFKKSILNEIEHIKRNNLEPVLKSDVPKGIVILPTVWAMH